MSSDERQIAFFLDFENIALGVKEKKKLRFDIDLMLQRLLEKGKSWSNAPTETGAGTRLTGRTSTLPQ